MLIFERRTHVRNKTVNGKTPGHKAGKLPFILSLLIVCGLILSYFIFPSYKNGIDEAFHVLTSEDPELIREWVSQFGLWGPLALIMALVLQMFLFFVPNILLILICILSYGPIWGAIIAWTGIVLASTVGYFVGNKLSLVVVHRLVSPKTRRMLQGFIQSYGVKAIVVLRLSTFSNDGLSIVAGLLNMSYKRYIMATIIGITPLITVLALFGKNARIEKGLVWVGAALVLGLVGYIALDRRRLRRKGASARDGA